MSMSRKHFEEIARILREHKADGVMIRDIADFCAATLIFFAVTISFKMSGASEFIIPIPDSNLQIH